MKIIKVLKKKIETEGKKYLNKAKIFKNTQKMTNRPISKEDELEVAFKIWKINETIKTIRGNSQDNKKTKSIYLTGFDSPVKSYQKVYDNMQAIK